MNKDIIAKHIIKNIENSQEEKDIIKAIEDTLVELENIRTYFDSVSEPKLVDVAIYSEQAIRAKYSYLLEEARKLNIKLDSTYVFRSRRCS